MKRHLLKAHEREPQVAEAAVIKCKEEQYLAFEKLRFLGNYKHNIRTYESRKGTLIVKRRSVNNKCAEDYLPCLYCLGFVESSGLWHHVKCCKHKPSQCDEEEESPCSEKEKEYSIISRCRMLLGGSLTVYKADHLNYGLVKDNVVKTMREGAIKDIVAEDDLILNFGTVLLERSGERRSPYISSKMKQLGRLVQKAREIEGTTVCLMDMIKPQTFWLANHLGHEVSIHKSVYRLHEDAIEVAKISRLLLAIENGRVSQYKGKELHEIGVAGK